MKKLEKALKINAVFSSISGTIMIILNQQLNMLFGTNNKTVFWIIGLILIFFALTIFYETKKQRKLAVLWIIIQDFIWVIGSIIILIWNPFQISINGNYLIGIVALIVFYMGINQSRAIRE